MRIRNFEFAPYPSHKLILHLLAHSALLAILLRGLLCVGVAHKGLAIMPGGKALNAYVFLDGGGVVHTQHKAMPTWCEVSRDC